MVLPSISDALIVIVLLIPGFIAFWITKRIGKFNRPLSEFETSVWSFVFSAIILFFFTSSTGLWNLDLIREKFFEPQIFGALFLITGVVGFAGGGIFYLSNRNRTIEESQSWALKLHDKYTEIIRREEKELEKSHENGDIPERLYQEEQKKLDEKKKKAMLTIFTRDNNQYEGYLVHATYDSWDILITKAFPDEKWERLLIKGEDITKIFFHSPESD